MKKNSRLTIGCDLGDRNSEICVLDEAGEVVSRQRFATTAKRFAQVLSPMAGNLVVIEVGTHSPWVSRLLASLSLEVLVANPRQVALIYRNVRKSDRTDAENLARLARVDPSLLRPIQHRSEDMQRVRITLGARTQLVKTRAQLVTSVRGLVKSYSGKRLQGCSTAAFATQAAAQLAGPLSELLTPMLEAISTVTAQIKALDCQVKNVCAAHQEEVRRLTQVPGIGALTAVSYIATLDDPTRFKRSRDVGAYLGMVPKRDQSGSVDRQLGITKCGDPQMRRLLVQCAHVLLGPFGGDCDLREWGLKLAARGGRGAKKKAIVAVARRLAVLMHRLWLSGEAFVPRGYSHKTALAA